MGWPSVNDGFRSEAANTIRRQGQRGGDKHKILSRTADLIESLRLDDPRLILLNRLQFDSDHYSVGGGASTFLARVGVNPIVEDSTRDAVEAFHTLLAATVLDRIGTDQRADEKRANHEATTRQLSAEITAEQERTAEAQRVASVRAQDNSDLRGQLKAARVEADEWRERYEELSEKTQTKEATVA